MVLCVVRCGVVVPPSAKNLQQLSISVAAVLPHTCEAQLQVDCMRAVKGISAIDRGETG